MKQQDASNWLRAYMCVHLISLRRVSADLNIPREILEFECKEPFTADQFLSLCAYLDIDVDGLLSDDE